MGPRTRCSCDFVRRAPSQQNFFDAPAPAKPAAVFSFSPAPPSTAASGKTHISLGNLGFSDVSRPPILLEAKRLEILRHPRVPLPRAASGHAYSVGTASDARPLHPAGAEAPAKAIVHRTPRRFRAVFLTSTRRRARRLLPRRHPRAGSGRRRDRVRAVAAAHSCAASDSPFAHGDAGDRALPSPAMSTARTPPSRNLTEEDRFRLRSHATGPSWCSCMHRSSEDLAGDAEELDGGESLADGSIERTVRRSLAQTGSVHVGASPSCRDSRREGGARRRPGGGHRCWGGRRDAWWPSRAPPRARVQPRGATRASARNPTPRAFDEDAREVDERERSPS